MLVGALVGGWAFLDGLGAGCRNGDVGLVLMCWGVVGTREFYSFPNLGERHPATAEKRPLRSNSAGHHGRRQLGLVRYVEGEGSVRSSVGRNERGDQKPSLVGGELCPLSLSLILQSDLDARNQQMKCCQGYWSCPVAQGEGSTPCVGPITGRAEFVLLSPFFCVPTSSLTPLADASQLNPQPHFHLCTFRPLRVLRLR